MCFKWHTYLGTLPVTEIILLRIWLINCDRGHEGVIYMLSSMWKGFPIIHIVTCQNLHFGKYVGLTVCLSVCLSVCPSLYKITDNSRTLWDIFTKISSQMYLGCRPIAISFQGQKSKVKVTRSQQRSKLEIAVTPLIFELQQNLKNHNVVLLKAHLYDIINFRYHFRFKRSFEVENRKCEIAISTFVSFQHSSNLIAYLETTCQI